MPPAEPLVVDDSAASPDLAALRRALDVRDWDAATGVLAGPRTDGRTMLIRWAARDADLDFLRKVHESDPFDSTAGAMLGERLVLDAWAIRSTRRARHVSQAQFDAFHAGLNEAEEVLAATAVHDPADPAVWTSRLKTARGLELGEAETRRRYAALAAIDPHHTSGQWQMLQRLCPKWGGTLDAMHAFARECMLAAPEGGHAGFLVADAYLEEVGDLPDAAAQSRFLGQRSVRAALREAAARSVLHPSFPRTPGWVQVAGTFGMILTYAGELDLAHRSFQLVGPWVSAYPWGGTADPVGYFRRIRGESATGRQRAAAALRRALGRPPR
ncbi:hypothetical protein AB0J82_08890 [Asanoa sp. NPDC049518]|uniref:hypothetical protein n=1 Tax=unclassified Asanoa TaxID=2685164 RepID=UPI00342E09F3